MEQLVADISRAWELLSRPADPPKTASGVSFKSTKSTKSIKSTNSIKTFKSPPLAKNLLAKVSTPFRLVRSRTQGKTYGKMDESRSLISDDRRGSADSDATLVGSDPGADTVGYSADQLLEVLAPLVSALQRLTPRLDTADPPRDLLRHHHLICEKLTTLFDDVVRLHGNHSEQTDSRDEHDLEMSSLMLDALRKKVDSERFATQPRGALIVREVEVQETVIEQQRAGQESPLLPVSKNPFIVHPTSIALSSSRRSSVSSNVPIGEKAIPPGTYSSFLAGGQQTWAKNVIRIGSYQNSMLFSPSPVAVRPLASFGRP